MAKASGSAFGVYRVEGQSVRHRVAYSCFAMGGCQNYGPFLVPIIIRHMIFRVPKKGP